MSLKRFHVKRQTDSYLWSENEEFITISCTIKNMAMKYIDVFISDLYVKVNVPKIKFIQVWDLQHPIVIGHLKNRTTLANNQLEIKLVKETPGLWTAMEFDGTKQEKLERRNESINRLEQWDKAKGEAQGETKLMLDKAALDKQMQLEAWERKVLSDKKEEERKYVEDRLYEDIEQIEQLNEKLKQGYDPKLVQQEAEQIAKASVNKIDPSRREDRAEEGKSEVRKVEKQPDHIFRKFNDPSKNIFDDSD
jgi:hypothetical protein